MAVFILDGASSALTNLGKHSPFVWLFVSSVKTQDALSVQTYYQEDVLSSVVRRSCRTTEDSVSRRIMRLVPVFTLETNNQTNNECWPSSSRRIMRPLV